VRLPINPTCRHGEAFAQSAHDVVSYQWLVVEQDPDGRDAGPLSKRCAQVRVPDVTPDFGRNRTVVPSQRRIRSLAMKVADLFHAVAVRHEASCIRGWVRDPPLRAVAAVR
jgi:hypothetical protein